MKFKIVNVNHIPGIDFGEYLLKPFDATLVNGNYRTEDEIIFNAGDADALIYSPAQQITSPVLKAFSKCRIVAGLAVGYDRLDLDTATSLGIVVTNTPDYCLDEVSDHAILLMMALGRRLFRMDKAVRSELVHFTSSKRENIQKIAYPIFRLRDQTLGVIGLGKIGTATAIKARGLGMRVIAYDPYVFGSVMTTRGAEPVDFDRLLKESDFITMHALLNEETKEMIGYPEFKKMKPTCYFINTARGGLVDEKALVQALKEGVIAGAGLDVHANEPIKKNDPLLTFENVILTGHSAWYSTASDSAKWPKAMTQVVTALKGEWPLYAVNPEVKSKWIERWGM